RMQDLPGEELFCYVDEDGATRSIESDDVNRYLKECAGEEFTSKNFRTWAGTLLAAHALRGRTGETAADMRRELAQAVAEVARKLGNTPAVCRKCYIHPAVLEAFAAGTLAPTLKNGADRRSVVALLERHAGREARRAREHSNLPRLLRRSLRRGGNPHARGTPLAATSHAVSS
ncbi:MAG TPA: DNA topoisomerase IB, partial [Burkholderiales bacterium]|nr:DNA topoisomerase IB [Burkholderiales bacterium]